MVGHEMCLIFEQSFYLSLISRTADDANDVSSEETIAQLKLAFSELSNSYRKLCEEMALLSRYVALHERAFQVTLRSHDLAHTHHSLGKEVNITTQNGPDARRGTNAFDESAHPSLPQVNNAQ